MNSSAVSIAMGSVLALAVVSFVWSAVLTFLTGGSLQDTQPWAVYTFMFTHGFGGRAGTLLWHSFLIAVGGSGVFALPLFFFGRPTYYGDARWARGGEVRRAQLLAPDGLLVGKLGQRLFLRNAEPVHLLVAAPTRSGKGVGIVLPNLLSWPGSVIVLDIKHENYAVTAGYRGQGDGRKVFKWAPMEAHSHCYNPLDWVAQDGSERISDLQLLATILLPLPERADPMWVNEARDLFLGVALLVLDDPRVPSTFGQIYRTLKRETDLAEIAKLALEQRDPPLDPACRQALANFKNKAPKEQSGVKSTLTAALNLWANPHIDAATAVSDFDLRECRRRHYSIYVGVAQNQLVTLAPLLNLFFQQAVGLLSSSLPGPEEKHEVLLMIDEFPLLGKMQTLQIGLGILAGYNIRIALIVQGLGQLKDIYGPAGMEGILQNCALQVFFAPNDDTTTNYVSKRLGTKTVQVRNRSQDQEWKTTTTTTYIAQPFLLPEQVRRLPPAQEIVFKENARPILGQKIRYYSDRAFTRRILPSPPVPALDVQPPPPDPAERAVVELAQLTDLGPPPEGPDAVVNSIGELPPPEEYPVGEDQA